VCCEKSIIISPSDGGDF